MGQKVLERAGYTVIIASTGGEATEIYAREQSNISLVVLDLVMPQMPGGKFLAEYAKINLHVKILVSTGHSLVPEERERLGAYSLVNKPYQMKQFLEVVKTAPDTEWGRLSMSRLKG